MQEVNIWMEQPKLQEQQSLGKESQLLDKRKPILASLVQFLTLNALSGQQIVEWQASKWTFCPTKNLRPMKVTSGSSITRSVATWISLTNQSTTCLSKETAYQTPLELATNRSSVLGLEISSFVRNILKSQISCIGRMRQSCHTAETWFKKACWVQKPSPTSTSTIRDAFKFSNHSFQVTEMRMPIFNVSVSLCETKQQLGPEQVEVLLGAASNYSSNSYSWCKLGN